VTIPV